jgi:hypothetical protein
MNDHIFITLFTDIYYSPNYTNDSKEMINDECDFASSKGQYKLATPNIR